MRFVFFIIFTLLILLIRGSLKKNKHKINYISKNISDRSVMLTNVNRDVSAEEIKRKFREFPIEHIEFTYKNKLYFRELLSLFQLKKDRRMSLKKKSVDQKIIENLENGINIRKKNLEMIHRILKSNENRIDIAFVTFRKEEDRIIFLKKYRTNLL